MFCFNCGKEISNDQKYCCFCGAENKLFLNSDLNIIQNKTKPTREVKPSDIIFNRDVLINYLYNLQTLEFAKNKLEYIKENLEYKIGSLCHASRVSPKASLSDYGACFGGFVAMVGIFLLALWLDSKLKNSNSFFSIFEGILHPIFVILMFLSAIIAVIIIFYAIYETVEDAKRFEIETQNEAQRMEIEKQEYQRLSRILPNVNKDLDNTMDLLKSAYSLNIIPDHDDYRSLYGIYFLYKYISTSQVSLNEAFFHFDLNEIKSKLDVIIEQQREIILKLAHSNALNEQIVKQNSETLRHAIATERNTELTACYSQIASLNSETVAQIQNYYFYKNGL